MLDRRPDIQAKDQHGNSPLHIASSYSNIETIRVLLAHSAEIEAKDNSGWSPLHLACLTDSEADRLILLFENGADVKIIMYMLRVIDLKLNFVSKRAAGLVSCLWQEGYCCPSKILILRHNVIKIWTKLSIGNILLRLYNNCDGCACYSLNPVPVL